MYDMASINNINVGYLGQVKLRNIVVLGQVRLSSDILQAQVRLGKAPQGIGALVGLRYIVILGHVGLIRLRYFTGFDQAM